MQHVWVEPMAAPHRKTSLILRPGQQLNLKDVARLLGFDSEAPLRLQLANNTVSGIPMAGQATVRWSIEDLRTLTGRAGCETAPFLLQGLPMDAAKSQEAGLPLALISLLSCMFRELMAPCDAFRMMLMSLLHALWHL